MLVEASIKSKLNPSTFMERGGPALRSLKSVGGVRLKGASQI